MNDVNNVDLSELKLYYKLNPNIPFNEKKISFVLYLKGLREFDKKSASKPSNIGKLFVNSLAVLTFGVFSVIFYGEALSQIMKVFQNTFLISDYNYILNLGIPRLFVAPILIFSFLLAGSIMLLADIFFILRFILGVHKNWTIYHRQILILAEKLQEMNILEDFFVYQKEKKAFQLM